MVDPARHGSKKGGKKKKQTQRNKSSLLRKNQGELDDLGVKSLWKEKEPIGDFHHSTF